MQSAAKVEKHCWHHLQWRVRANTLPVTSSCLRNSATCCREHKDGLFPLCSTSAPERAIWGLHASGMEMLGGSEAPPPKLTSNVYAWDVNKRFLQFFYSSVHNETETFQLLPAPIEDFMGSGSQHACSSWKAAGFHMRSGEFMRKQEHMLHGTSHTATHPCQ